MRAVRERSPGGDPGTESLATARQFDRTHRTADRLIEQATWATTTRRSSLFIELRAAWVAAVTGRAA